MLDRVVGLEQREKTVSEYADLAENHWRDMVDELDEILAQIWVAGLSNKTLAKKIAPMPAYNPGRSVFIEMGDRANIADQIMRLESHMENMVSSIDELEVAMEEWRFGQHWDRKAPLCVTTPISRLRKQARDCEVRLRNIQ